MYRSYVHGSCCKAINVNVKRNRMRFLIAVVNQKNLIGAQIEYIADTFRVLLGCDAV
jgi:hypothetical protein